MRIQKTKIMRIHADADADPQHCHCLDFCCVLGMLKLNMGLSMRWCSPAVPLSGGPIWTRTPCRSELSSLCSLVSSLGTTLAEFFHQAELLMQNHLNGLNAQPIASSKLSYRRLPVISTSVMKSGFLTFLLQLFCLWSMVIFSSFTALMSF